MFSKKYKKRIQELEKQLENSEREIQEYRKDNIYLTGRVKQLKSDVLQLRKELEILPKRNSKGQYEKRRKKTINA